MNPIRELKKIAAELQQMQKISQTISYSVGGFYPNGNTFGREFSDLKEAQDYFEGMKSRAASMSLYKWVDDQEEEEIDSYMA